jgi:hypothetical protein
MVRTRVQLTEVELSGLRQLSASTGKSIAELVRNGVDEYLAVRGLPPAGDRVERAIRVAGMFSSGRTDVSVKHDRYLTAAFDGGESLCRRVRPTALLTG